MWNPSTCKHCNQKGHTAADHCEHCNAIGHIASEHCQVCDAVYCNADIHCNVCEDVDHTSKDHCGLCRELGHTEDDHCVRCKQLGHDSPECLESDPVSIELCWTCRNYGHNRNACPYRFKDELRVNWAYKLKRRAMHEKDDYCKCCRVRGKPDDHRFADCPKMTHRVGCLEKTHDNPRCIEWMSRSRKEKYRNDASTQTNLADYSTDVGLETFHKGKEKSPIPDFHLPPNVFTVTSSSAQTTFAKVGVVDESEQVDELASRIFKEESPVNQKATALGKPVEEVQRVEAICDPNYGWGDFSRSVGHLVGLPDGFEYVYRNDPVEEDFAHTDIRRGDHTFASEPDIPEDAPFDGDDLKFAPTSSLDRRDCQRNAHTDMSQTPQSFSNRHGLAKNGPSSNADMLIDRSLMPDRRHRQRNPSPERKVHVKAEMTIDQQEAGSSTVAYIETSEDLSEDIKIPAVRVSSPDVQRGRSPIMTMTQIREEPVPSHMLKYWIPSIDGRRKPKTSSQIIGIKRLTEPKPSELLTEKRQKKDVKPPKLVNTAPPGKTIDQLDEGVWLDSELQIQWKDLSYMVLFEAPNHSTNLKQLHNLVTNWLRNNFPTYTSIHNRAGMYDLNAIMQASPHIESQKWGQSSNNPNPIDFFIRKDALASVEAIVKAFRIELATFKYQMCMLKNRPPGTKPRPGISFENLIGMALHKADARLLSQKEIENWIEANIPGYDHKGWVPWMEEELHASSFFIQMISGEGSDQWTFRKGCEEFFAKKEPKAVPSATKNSVVRKKVEK